MEDAAWYYRLGGRTLGPVSWAEIEQLTKDAIDAGDLLVARAGDEQWRSAADVIDERADAADQERPEVAAEPEPEPEPARSVAAPGRAPAPAGPAKEFTPEHGLGKWIGQAWEMVINEIWAWVGGLLLMMLVAGLTLGITGPPLTAGLYMMALKRYRGEDIRAGSVFEGFSRFGSSWGLALIMMVPMVLLMAPMMILFAIPAMQAQGGGNIEDLALGVTVAAYVLMPAMWLLIMGVQTIFFYSWVLVAEGYRAWESVTMSWEKVGRQFWSYLGTWLVLSILASIGSYACYVGWFLTYPLLPCAQVAAYMWHFRRA
ncbi:MAG: GYF domain-containing protein [Armatimonadota bacterium]